MRKYFVAFATGIVLSGCAGNSFVPTVVDSSADYGLLVRGLRCEVEDIMDFDRDSPNSPRYFYSEGKRRFASIAIQIDGHLDRSAGVAASIGNYEIGKHSLLSASTGLSSSTNDVGTVIMGDNVLPTEHDCEHGDRARYDMRRLGLLAWYKDIASNVRTKQSGAYLDEMKFIRTGTVTFGPNGASVAFFSPGSITPSAAFQIARVVQIEIDFADVPSKPTVALDQSSIDALADAIRSGGRSDGAKRKHGRAAAGPGLPSPAEVLREGQIDRLDKSLKNIDTLIQLNGL